MENNQDMKHFNNCVEGIFYSCSYHKKVCLFAVVLFVFVCF